MFHYHVIAIIRERQRAAEEEIPLTEDEEVW